MAPYVVKSCFLSLGNSVQRFSKLFKIFADNTHNTPQLKGEANVRSILFIPLGCLQDVALVCRVPQVHIEWLF